MHIIFLSGENLKLARLEADSLLRLENSTLSGSYLYCTVPTESMKIVNRLAYTKKFYEVLYTTSRKNLEASLETYPWMNIYEKDFCIRITSKEHYDERYYSGFVWKNLEKSTRPKVNLSNPMLFIEIFIDKEIATVTRLLYQNFETYETRKAHLKPVLHPTAMHPKMSRALINILNPGPNEKIIDPFCGACGILTEAGLLGLKFEGYDIDQGVLDSAKINLDYYDIDPKNYTLIKKDSTQVKDLKNVVTDLPYGKSSKKSEELVQLYSKFLKNLSGRTIVVMPDFMPYKSLLDKNLPKNLWIIAIIDHYVHKSLTRKIILIDKKPSRNMGVTKNKVSNTKRSNKTHSTKIKKIKSRVKSKKTIKKVHKKTIKKIAKKTIKGIKTKHTKTIHRKVLGKKHKFKKHNKIIKKKIVHKPGRKRIKR